MRHFIATMIGVISACIHVKPPVESPVCVTVPIEEPPPPAPAPPPALAPLNAAAPFMDLPVPGYESAIVSVPVGATSRRPLLVAAHGAGDRPEWQCSFWREIVGDRAFVLCPRGYPMNPHTTPDKTGYFYTTHHQLGDEIESAMAALLARFRPHVDPAAPVFAGFSQGAVMGALLLPQHPARFARAALIEGGAGTFQEWNRHAARRFRERGGVRVLFACGRAECAGAAEISEGYMAKEGLAAQVVHAPGAGHTYGGPVGDEVARAFSWLIAGDERFSPLPP